jgi:hypothetical protein
LGDNGVGCKGRGWTFLDLVHGKPPRPSALGLDLIRQRSAQVLAPARLAADLGSRAVRPGGPMAGAWRHVVPRTTGTRANCCRLSCLTLTLGYAAVWSVPVA